MEDNETEDNIKIDKKLRKWQRDLINLGLRNKLLNFKPTELAAAQAAPKPSIDSPKAPRLRQVGTGVTIVDELPEQIFRTLQIDGKSMTFLPSKDGGHVGVNPEHVRKVAEKGNQLESKYTDTKLQTCLTEDKLGTTLLRLHQKANTCIEEQGINSLALALGVIEWYEAKDSDKLLKAPIVLLPVELVRRGATSDYSLKTTMEDPIVNPALAEKLRLDFKITVPDLPESFEDFKADQYFKEFADLIASQPGWSIKEDVHLDIFSFAKYPMYKEIEDFFAIYLANEKITDLCLGNNSGKTAFDTIQKMDLDTEFLPESCFHILDADSSQQRAILAAKKNLDLVIQGPPGTGKSQTITNIIADALADQKTVLFVSEKMAALNVVFERLAARGLRDFCLKLHSQDSTKKAVYSELQRTLSTPESLRKGTLSERQKLGDFRNHLNTFVREVHNTAGKMSISTYTAIGKCAMMHRAPKLQTTLTDVHSWSTEKFDQIREMINEVSSLLKLVGVPEEHAWYGCELLDYDVMKRNDLELQLQEALKLCHEIKQLGVSISATLGTVEPESFAELKALSSVYKLATTSKKIATSSICDDSWDDSQTEINSLVSSGKKHKECTSHWTQYYRVECLEDSVDDLAKRFSSECKSNFRFFRPTFWKLRSRVHAMRINSDKIPDTVLASALLDGVTAIECQEVINSQHSTDIGSRRFSHHWKGVQSDWLQLAEISNWLTSIRPLVKSQFLTDTGIQIAATGLNATDKSSKSVADLAAQLGDMHSKVRMLIEMAKFDSNTKNLIADDCQLEEVTTWLQLLLDNLPRLHDWCLFLESVQKCKRTEIRNFVLDYIRSNNDPMQMDHAFQQVFYTAWLHQALKSNEILRTFQSEIHSTRASEFRRIDNSLKDDSQYQLNQKLAQQRHTDLNDPDLASELMVLQRELKKKARQISVRRLLSSVPNTLGKIKPCFMMSPLSVAQYLNPKSHQFDLVVFDEASQITPEDALGSIIRGKQVIVVGDAKQLPPTNFFSQQAAMPADSADEEVEDSLESILDEFEAKLYPCTALSWHYRSKHASLIAFSNKNFYGNQLVSLPSSDIDTSVRGLQYQHVDGIYEGSGGNSIEAGCVADAVVEHIRKNPHLSLGVGTFNQTQQKLILDAIDKRRQKERSIEFFFENKGEDRFFVKNLENIQGDDRDVIFISCSFGKDSSGKVQLNLGPISQQNGKRRLNVLFTRAKYKMRVFASIHGDEIDLERAQSEGARLLREFLIFAESGRLAVSQLSFDAEFDSSFEQAVYEALTEAGLKLIPQVGQSGFRIDLGVLDSDVPGRFLCGIECDGAPYHSAATARDRDRLRQEVLESLGWKLIRIWSLDWFHDKASQVKRIMAFVEQCKKENAETAASAQFEPESPQQQKDIDELKISITQEPIILKTATPYKIADVRQVASSDQFAQASNSQIQSLLLAVCRIEAPIHSDELMKRVLRHWGIARTGARIKSKLLQQLGELLDTRQIRTKGEFVYLPNAEIILRSRESIDTTPDFVCSEEYELCVLYALHNRTELMHDEVMLEAARLLGYKRTGQKLNDNISRAIEQLKQSQLITFGACGLRLVHSDSTKILN